MLNLTSTLNVDLTLPPDYTGGKFSRILKLLPLAVSFQNERPPRLYTPKVFPQDHPPLTPPRQGEAANDSPLAAPMQSQEDTEGKSENVLCFVGSLPQRLLVQAALGL